jgi:hypothetical protein
MKVYLGHQYPMGSWVFSWMGLEKRRGYGWPRLVVDAREVRRLQTWPARLSAPEVIMDRNDDEAESERQ